MLGFQAEGVTALVGVALLASDRSIKKVSGIKLDTGLRGRDFQHAATCGIVGARGQR